MFLQDEDKQEIRQFFAEQLEAPVRLIVFSQRAPGPEDPLPVQHELCRDLEAIMRELSELSDKLSLEIYDVQLHPRFAERYNIERVPAIAMLNGHDPGVRFYGVPTSYEFTTFLETVIQTSNGQLALNQATLDELHHVSQPIHIQVFYTPSCVFCPLTSQIALQMALANPLITADTIDAMEFPQLAERYGVRGAPHVIINETLEFVGMKSEATFLKHVLHAARYPCPVLLHDPELQPAQVANKKRAQGGAMPEEV
jgi:glutaredoxin-like protein